MLGKVKWGWLAGGKRGCGAEWGEEGTWSEVGMAVGWKEEEKEEREREREIAA